MKTFTVSYLFALALVLVCIGHISSAVKPAHSHLRALQARARARNFMRTVLRNTAGTSHAVAAAPPKSALAPAPVSATSHMAWVDLLREHRGQVIPHLGSSLTRRTVHSFLNHDEHTLEGLSPRLDRIHHVVSAMGRLALPNPKAAPHLAAKVPGILPTVRPLPTLRPLTHRLPLQSQRQKQLWQVGVGVGGQRKDVDPLQHQPVYT